MQRHPEPAFRGAILFIMDSLVLTSSLALPSPAGPIQKFPPRVWSHPASSLLHRNWYPLVSNILYRQWSPPSLKSFSSLLVPPKLKSPSLWMVRPSLPFHPPLQTPYCSSDPPWASRSLHVSLLLITGVFTIVALNFGAYIFNIVFVFSFFLIVFFNLEIL